MPASYRSPKTVIRKSLIEGKGLFARRAIRKGEIVAIKGGHVYDERGLAKIKSKIAASYVQIADGFYIGAATAAEVKKNKIFINHSCRPNVGIRGQIICVALRDIRAGEELTYDYNIDAGEPITPAVKRRWPCRCGGQNCRGTVLVPTEEASETA